MKREGRQHGMVRSYQILPPPWNLKSGSSGRLVVNQTDCPPTAGLFTRVSRKPTNHSKFTGKCGRVKCVGCHAYPACKSKGKAKGEHKLRSNDVVANHRLVSWRVVVDAELAAGYTMSAANSDDHLADIVEEYGLTAGEPAAESGFGGFEDQDDDDVDEEEDGGWYMVTEMSYDPSVNNFFSFCNNSF